MSNTRKAKASIEDIIAGAKLPEHTARICLRGDLLAEHERLESELAALGEFTASHLADTDPRRPVAEALRAVEAQMAEAESVFTFRALGRRKYRELVDAHPAEGKEFDPATFPQALIAACAVEPDMTPTDVLRLFDLLNEGQVGALFMAAYSVNEGAPSVPFSGRASEILSRRAPK